MVTHSFQSLPIAPEVHRVSNSLYSLHTSATSVFPQRKLVSKRLSSTGHQVRKRVEDTRGYLIRVQEKAHNNFAHQIGNASSLVKVAQQVAEKWNKLLLTVIVILQPILSFAKPFHEVLQYQFGNIHTHCRFLRAQPHTGVKSTSVRMQGAMRGSHPFLVELELDLEDILEKMISRGNWWKQIGRDLQHHGRSQSPAVDWSLPGRCSILGITISIAGIIISLLLVR